MATAMSSGDRVETHDCWLNDDNDEEGELDIYLRQGQGEIIIT